MRSVRVTLLSTIGATALLLGATGVASPAGSGEAAGPSPEAEPVTPDESKPEKADLTVRLKGRDGNVKVGKSATALGTIEPYAPGERVLVKLKRSGKTIANRRAAVTRVKGSDVGKFTFAKQVIAPGSYRFTATHAESDQLGSATGKTRRFGISYPALNQRSRGEEVAVLNKLLAKLSYVTTQGQGYGGPTRRAVLAYRKVNKMARTTNTTPRIFRDLAAGKGAFKLKNPGNGKQIEVDISRQVMVLAVDGEVQRTYHISTGAAATPTVRGKWSFYRRHPAFNAIGMFWSSFWVGGYAIHGYKSVPTHPASHGCVRTHLTEAKSIFDWIDDGLAGTTIFTYG